MAHGNDSRAEEIKFMARFLSLPNLLIQAFEEQPNGGSVELEGINFVWGNVSGLIPALKTRPLSTHESKFLELNPKHIYHLDNLSTDQERLIVNQFNIRPEALSFQSNKADVLLIDEDNQVCYVSIKDEVGLTKLGQVANKGYGTTRLTGGFAAVDLDRFNCPVEINYQDTWLDERQWNKIGLKDRKCAYIKRKFPLEWQLVVEDSLNNAYQCLKDFALKIKEDRNNICQFILLTLVGEAVSNERFFIVFGNQIIDIQRLMENIRTLDFEVVSEPYISQGVKRKESLIIWLVFPGRKYCLTKIEPAFDGGFDVKASQTKGIQYYFQHWPIKTNSSDSSSEDVYDFKQFLLDISQ
jgi:hypothetical protein